MDEERGYMYMDRVRGDGGWYKQIDDRGMDMTEIEWNIVDGWVDEKWEGEGLVDRWMERDRWVVSASKHF